LTCTGGSSEPGRRASGGSDARSARAHARRTRRAARGDSAGSGSTRTASATAPCAVRQALLASATGSRSDAFARVPGIAHTIPVPIRKHRSKLPFRTASEQTAAIRARCRRLACIRLHAASWSPCATTRRIVDARVVVERRIEPRPPQPKLDPLGVVAMRRKWIARQGVTGTGAERRST
jgi:hypothetical protein